MIPLASVVTLTLLCFMCLSSPLLIIGLLNGHLFAIFIFMLLKEFYCHS